MTDAEKVEVKRTTLDIRNLFESMSKPDTKREERRRQPPFVVVNNKTETTTTTTPEVSHSKYITKNNISSKLMRSRSLLLEKLPGSMQETPSMETPSMVAGMSFVTRDTEYADAASGRRPLCNVYDGVESVSADIRDDSMKNIDGMQLDFDVYKPGTLYDDPGDGGDRVGEGKEPGEGDECCSAITSLKPKPNEVGGGGLKAKIHLWEMKSGLINEKCVGASKSLRSGAVKSALSSRDRK